MPSAIRINVEPASDDLVRVIMDASALSNRIGIQVGFKWQGSNHQFGFTPEVVLTESNARMIADQYAESQRAYINSVRETLKP